MNKNLMLNTNLMQSRLETGRFHGANQLSSTEDRGYALGRQRVSEGMGTGSNYWSTD